MSVAVAPRRTLQLAAPTDLRPIGPPALAATRAPALLHHPVSEASSPGAVLQQARWLVARHNSSAVALARLAQAEQVAGNVAESAEAAHAALASAGPEDIGTVAAAARVLIAGGQLAEAEEALRPFDRRGPWAPLYASLAVARGDVEAAMARLEECDSVDALSLRGWLHLRRHKYDAAVSNFRGALRLGGIGADILTNIGYAYAALGSHAKAISATRQARALAPANRTVRFNLAAFYANCGDYDTALRELRELERLYPRDLKVRFARSRINVEAGDLEQALRVLRTTRHDVVFAKAPIVDRAELGANITFLEWQEGSLDRRTASRKLERELERCEFHSLSIVSMLCILLSRTSDAHRLAAILENLRGRFPEDKLAEPRMHLAMLQGEFSNAAALAQEWAQHALFDVNAAIMATYLVGDAADDYETASAIGLRTLKVVPAADGLANNVAYSLAMAGRPQEARRYLPKSPHSAPVAVATAALIDITLERHELGLAGYARARELALREGEWEGAALLALRRALTAKALRHEPVDLAALEASLPLPAGWKENPDFQILLGLARRGRLLG